MPVSGREIASLDFAKLIGGPLNAVVEAQAMSAITTANFIKEVGFNQDGSVKNMDFKYNRKNDNGSDQEFTLTLPFLTMLPVPYITISSAVIEFNAKITSTTESSMEDNFSQNIDAEVGGKYWFVSAKVTSKTAYQRKTATSDKEERTFDMHVRVEAKNQDMPAGTERILTLLENSIQEKTSHKLLSVGLTVTGIDTANKKLLQVSGADFGTLIGATANAYHFTYRDVEYKVTKATAATTGSNPTPATIEIDSEPPETIVNATLDLAKSKP